MEEKIIRGLYTKYYPGTRATVIVMHGMLSSMGEFFDYPEKINSKGYAVLIFDFSGHGKSKGIQGYENMNKNLDDLKKILDFIRENSMPRPIILLGHSLGAATVIYALARGMGDIGVAIAPPTTIRDEMNTGEKILLPLIYSLGIIYEKISGKKFYIKYRANYESIYVKKETAEKAREMNFLGNRIWIGSYKPLMKTDTVDEARNVKKPCLIVVPTQDKLVNPQHGKMLFENLNGIKEIYLAKGYNHSVMGEDKGDVISAILEFIEGNIR